MSMYESTDPKVSELIGRYNIDVIEDVRFMPRCLPRIAASEHITRGGGDYFFTQLDYCDGDEVRASRMIAEILPGNRTELAYWDDSAPEKELTVHRGRCEMIVGDPLHGTTRVVDATAEDSYGCNLELPPGVFYTLRPPEDSTETLVISGFYEQPIGDWANLEQVVQPGEREADTPDGPVRVPKSFLYLFNQEV